MPTDHFRYDLLAKEALRGVVRRVLADAAKNGLPGDHHFFLSLDTRAPGVMISQRVRNLYPEEMTIILQHQFWDLVVTDEGFEVGLSFKGVPERIAAPFSALKGFFDPSVKFGLKFEVASEATGATGEPSDEGPRAVLGDASAEKTKRPARASARKLKSGSGVPVTVPSKSDTAQDDIKDAAEATEAAASPGAEVVRLDRFRKK